MEMRLILSHLLHGFTFDLAPPYTDLHDVTVATASTDAHSFRGVNRGGTMGPMDLESAESSPHTGYRRAMVCVCVYMRLYSCKDAVVEGTLCKVCLRLVF